MMSRFVAAAVIVLIGGPALADTTANYASEDGSSKIKVEIAEDGTIRLEMTANPGVYFITHKNQDFLVRTTPSGAVSDRWDDLRDAFEQVLSEKMPQVRRRFSAFARAGPLPAFKAGGRVSVNGRSGIPYYLTRANISGQLPACVISHDTSLEPIGRAMARQFKISEQLSQAEAGFVPPQVAARNQIYMSGTPLSYGQMRLITVDHNSIPLLRFELPSKVETRSEIVERLRSTSTSHSVTAF